MPLEFYHLCINPGHGRQRVVTLFTEAAIVIDRLRRHADCIADQRLLNASTPQTDHGSAAQPMERESLFPQRLKIRIPIPLVEPMSDNCGRVNGCPFNRVTMYPGALSQDFIASSSSAVIRNPQHPTCLRVMTLMPGTPSYVSMSCQRMRTRSLPRCPVLAASVTMRARSGRACVSAMRTCCISPRLIAAGIVFSVYAISDLPG